VPPKGNTRTVTPAVCTAPSLIWTTGPIEILSGLAAFLGYIRHRLRLVVIAFVPNTL
jgi:hypothetical protein